ncbi:MAG: C45 family peptidase [Desulfovibrio sp.]|nr:C45 family peptidase [Desulfovibrio sp.]
MASNFAYINLTGNPRERGRHYGAAASSQIRVSCDLYARLFAAYAALDWEGAKNKALRFAEAIAAYCPDALEEMRGIAEGCGLGYEDILALNCRSELMFALPDGCSTIALLPEHADGKTILAQTWDWLIECRPATVILEIHQEPLPTILTVAEAGMVGGKGINSNGLGVCLNALGVGWGRPGVPLHILYRGILNSKSISNALNSLMAAKRAGSGVFTIGSACGAALSFEYTPDNFDVLLPEKEPLCHTNHYLSPLFTGADTFKAMLPCTFIRYNLLRRQILGHRGQFTLDDVWSILSNHVNFPDSICSHEDPEDAPMSRFCSIYGVAMDLNAKTLWVTNGNPCEGPAYPFFVASAG